MSVWKPISLYDPHLNVKWKNLNFFSINLAAKRQRFVIFCSNTLKSGVQMLIYTQNRNLNDGFEPKQSGLHRAKNTEPGQIFKIPSPAGVI